MLTTVGGGYENWLGNDKYSNALYSFKDGKWDKHFLAMSKKRESPGAASTSSTLVVAGGSNAGNDIEIMDIRFKEWSTVSSLPFTTSQPSITICRNDVYLHPRFGYGSHQSVVKCSLVELKYSKPKTNKWKNVSSLPVKYSTLASINDHLLAIGRAVDGKREASDDKKEILEYNQEADSWKVVSEMIEAPSCCLTATLPDNKLMVVGGTFNSNFKIEIASFI